MRMTAVETVAAISGEFHRDVRYAVFYAAEGPSLGGFPGIWTWIAERACTFEFTAQRLGARWGETHDYIEAVDAFVDLLFTEPTYAAADILTATALGHAVIAGKETA